MAIQRFDATDLAAGAGVYDKTGNTLQYTAWIALPWLEIGGITVRITLHEYHEVESGRVDSIKPYRVGLMMFLRVPIGGEGNYLEGLYRITAISEANELTLEEVGYLCPDPDDVEMIAE